MDAFYFYLDRPSPLHRLDGLTKLIILAGNCAPPFFLREPGRLGVMAGIILVQALVAGAMGNVRRVAGFLLTITLATLLLWTLTGRGATPLFLWVTRESFLLGLAAALRIDCFILAGTIFLSTTRNEELVQGMVRLRIPYPVCFAFSTALRLAPTFVGTGWAVREAQKARGLDPDEGSPVTRLRRAIPLLVPTFLTTIRLTTHLAMSLESRGFGYAPRRTFLRETRPGVADGVALLALAAMLTAAWILRGS